MIWSKVKHFKQSEFDSPDKPGSGAKIRSELVYTLDKIRAECGFPFRVNSGYRTPEHDKKVGGKGGAHVNGTAVDIATSGSRQRMLIVQVALKHGVNRIGIGRNFVHIDMDKDLPQTAMWDYYKTKDGA